ncbi:putative glycosyltransferase [Variovorax paradoxus B4]|uniref:Putative glycosyltransferase n=2 Tax=Variovorax paradoxus TaxID=34073 RepID=T1XIP1_VARPD|nr:putative glycosyltransferase [Variovorax paradoxus B4]
MRILLINHYAGSPLHGMEYRPYYLAREWVRAGHEVCVVAASHSHVRRVQPPVDEGAVEQLIDGIRYCWLPTPAYVGNGVSRLRNVGSFVRQLWRDAADWVTKVRPDVVIASSTYPMDFWAARRIARCCGAKLVYEVHDLWPASLIELTGMSAFHPFALLCQKAENDAYRDADAVVSMLPKVAEHMQAHGLDLRRLHIVPNGIALDDWQDEGGELEPDLAGQLRDFQKAGKTIVGYAGSHGMPNALDTLLDAATLLRDQAIAFVLVGDGHEKPRLARRVFDEGLSNVALFPPIGKSQIPSFLRRLDIAYIGWKRVSIYRFGISPNKLMDYMMAGCAVLHSADAGNDPVAEAECGLTVAPESATAVAEGVKALAVCSVEERAAMGARGRAFVISRHSYRMLAQQFINAVHSS